MPKQIASIRRFDKNIVDVIIDADIADRVYQELSSQYPEIGELSKKARLSGEKS